MESLPLRLLMNGLSIGSGGGYTVARELVPGFSVARPNWRVSLYLIDGHSLHKEFEREAFPPNVELRWAPSYARNRLARLWFERVELCRWARRNHVRSVVMLNGQHLPCAGIPVLSHNQDPWPYRPEAWQGFKDRATAFFKRRQQRNGMARSQVYGWTSHYLRDLVCEWHGVRPRSDAVFYNGLPEAWIERAGRETAIPLANRPLEIVTVGNVNPYKRHALVVRAVAALRKLPGLESLSYRVLGHGPPDELAAIRSAAKALGIEHAVQVEGRVSAERVVQALSESRAFVLMSVCESFGLPAIEAMTFGTPVVVSDSCAHPEICQDAAALVREDDLEHLTETLRWVLQERDRAEGLVARGRHRAQEFRWSTTVHAMLRHVEPLMTDLLPPSRNLAS